MLKKWRHNQAARFENQWIRLVYLWIREMCYLRPSEIFSASDIFPSEMCTGENNHALFKVQHLKPSGSTVSPQHSLSSWCEMRSDADIQVCVQMSSWHHRPPLQSATWKNYNWTNLMDTRAAVIGQSQLPVFSPACEWERQEVMSLC